MSTEECKLIPKTTKLLYPIIGILIVIIILALLFIADKLLEKIKTKKKEKRKTQHNKYKEKVRKNLEKIKKGKYWLIIIAIIALATISIQKTEITGFAIKKTVEAINLGRIFALLFISSTMGLMITFYRRYKWKFKVKETKEIPKNQLASLLHKKVYTEEGELIGKVEDIHIKDNRIDYLRIKLNKNIFDFGGIIIKYKEVESVGDIIIIKETLVEILRNKKV